MSTLVLYYLAERRTREACSRCSPESWTVWQKNIFRCGEGPGESERDGAEASRKQVCVNRRERGAEDSVSRCGVHPRPRAWHFCAPRGAGRERMWSERRKYQAEREEGVLPEERVIFCAVEL